MKVFTTPPATDLSDRVVIFPLDKAEIRPDMILFYVMVNKLAVL
jgi:hypothetical protein